MQNKLEPWILLTFTDILERYDKSMGMPLGLYVVETNEFLLFKGSNIYLSAMVSFANEENIPFKLLEILKVKVRHPSSDFNNVIDKFEECSFGNQEIYKNMCNSLAGFIGKTNDRCTQHVRYCQANDNSEKHMMHHIHKYEHPFFNSEWDDLGNKYLVYGDRFYTQKLQHNLPIWIQILDHSNIELYKLGNSIGGEVVYRKTDSITCMGGADIGEDKSIGGYKNESNPKIPKFGLGLMKTDTLNLEHVGVTQFTEHTFTDSSEWKGILDTAETNDGMMVLGRAGTGKSFVIKQISNFRDQGNTSTYI